MTQQFHLLPCPFCGGKAELIEPHDKSRPYVMCIANYCTTPKDTPDEAVDAWNARFDHIWRHA